MKTSTKYIGLAVGP